MSVTPTIKMEMQFSGTAGAWSDVTADVQYPIRSAGGMMGNTLGDRVASTGVLSFNLNNSTSNSSGTMGYYSPGGSGVRAGFAPGIPTRLSIVSMRLNSSRIGLPAFRLPRGQTVFRQRTNAKK